MTHIAAPFYLATGTPANPPAAGRALCGSLLHAGEQQRHHLGFRV